MSDDNDSLVDSHEERLQTLDATVNNLSLHLTPTLARLEQTMTYMADKLDNVGRSVSETKEAVDDLRLQEVTREVRVQGVEKGVQDLHDAENKRQARRWSAVKWFGGIVSAVVLAAILAALGLN